MAEALRNLNPIERIERSERLLRLLWAEPRFAESEHIFCYVSMSGEVDTHPLIRGCLTQGKSVSIPRVLPDSNSIEARGVSDWDDDIWIDGPFGIREPDPDMTDFVPPETIDCVIVPGLAFDAEGYRLGRGKGYYDRFLAAIGGRAFRVAPAFDFQLVERVPREPHDEKVHLVLTA